MNLIGYRVLDTDEDGDPLDHGVVVANDVPHAVMLVTDRLREVFEDALHATVRFYDYGPLTSQTCETVGCLGPTENTDIHIDTATDDDDELREKGSH